MAGVCRAGRRQASEFVPKIRRRLPVLANERKCSDACSERDRFARRIRGIGNLPIEHFDANYTDFHGFQMELQMGLHYQHLRDPALLIRMIDGQALINRLLATMNAIARNAANGLVRIDPKLPWDRCSYGFTDSVRMTGDVLFCSLLDVQASQQLADLLDAVGKTADAAVWRAHADVASASIRRVFWDASLGLFRAATVCCREPDIWGSAFAVHLGVATEVQADAVATYFRDHHSQLVQAGQIRHLPGGVYWEAASCAPNTYQNGGFWATASGWFAQTLARVDPQLADATLVAMVEDFRLRGVNEWVFVLAPTRYSTPGCPVRAWRRPIPSGSPWPRSIATGVTRMPALTYAIATISSPSPK